MAPRIHGQRWIFSRGTDLAVFGGSAALAFALAGVGYLAGLWSRPFPPWAWVATVLLVDVAHVWSTLFRVYLDPTEVQRRRRLYLGIPVVAYVAGALLYTAGHRVFWGALAYLAVFHFVRQQYGWVAIYRKLNRDDAPLDRLLDTAAIYNATVFPIVWWHGHLPRAFVWFVAGDFLPGLPARLADALHPVHLAIMAAWALRQAWLLATRRPVGAGKALVVTSTWACWYGGIVAVDSDYVFTVTNVLIHGIPYLALTWRYAARRLRARVAPGEAPREPTLAEAIVRRGWPAFVAFVVALAFLEEGLWDQLVNHERAWLFGDAGVRLPDVVLALVVPLLALPQAVHYALDGWVWRAGPANPTLLEDLGFVPARAPSAEGERAAA
jgi:hypothetical protein